MNVARNTMDAASQLAGRDSPQQRGRQLADKVRNANAPTSTTINPGNQQ
jgi:hypothetical protein